METRFIYDLMLNYFVSYDELRPVMRNVHNGENGYLYASDGHIMIRIKQEKCMKQYDAVHKYPNAEELIQKAINRKNNKEAVIKTNDLIRLLSEVAWRSIKNGDKCEECDGTGEIECERCGNKSECEECKGSGVVNVSNLEFTLLQCDDSSYCIKIGDCVYKADYLFIIASMAQMCQASEIQYLYELSYEAGIFRFDGVDIFLMPFLADKANAVMRLK